MNLAPSPEIESTWYIREVDQASLEWSLDKALRRSGSMNHADTVNSKNMRPDRPGYWRHYVGIIGELAYSWFSEQVLGIIQKVDIKTIGRGDTGIDFPDGSQIKATDCHKVPRLMVIVSQWKRKEEKRFVLAWIRWNVKPLPTVSLMGWITREEFEKLHRIEDAGRAMGPSMWVDHKELHPMETLKYELHH